MLNYEIAEILHTLGPYLAGALAGGICVVIGILIDRAYWKPRIYRYADREIVKTLEYQDNKIKQLENVITDQKEIISDYKGHMKIAKKSALTIIGVVEK